MLRPLVFAVLTFACSLGMAQDTENFDRWEKNIQQFEAKIASGESKPGGILFIGSSSIVKWDLNKWFPDRHTVNHGFGGSELADSVHFFDRAVVPLKPRTVVMYAGDNDIAKGKQAGRVHSDFKKFAARLKQDLPPETRLLYIAVKPSVRRWELREEMAKANALIAADCAADDRLEYVDIWAPMLGDDGKPGPELFADDGLHLSEDGYALWTSVLKKQL